MQINCPTPHNSAMKGDFAKTVLMPGDPLRAEYIAKNFLTDARLVNNVRGIHGYTGIYRGEAVSVMASGMGMPSVGIYSYELFHFYGVENILRVGTVGAMQEALCLGDILLGMGACTDSNYAAQYNLCGTFAPIADYTLLKTAAELATAAELKFSVGNLLSTDCFYRDDENGGKEASERWRRMGVLGVEMEAAALYMNAARAGCRALAVCTVSDHLLTGEISSAKERQTAYTAMMTLSLDVAAKMAKR